MDLNQQVEALTASITELASELRDKQDIPQDRIESIEAEITTKSAQLDDLFAKKREQEVDKKLTELDERLKAFNTSNARTKATAILAGVQDQQRSHAVKAIGEYNENNFLKALVDRRQGSPEAYEFVKAVLGTTDATGQAIVPNNFVASLVEALTLSNPYRGVFEVVDGLTANGVDIPYEITAITAALLQGAYGSNKDVRDFQFAVATATLYSIAQIADIGNQLLRQSNGAAERAARRRLAGSIGMLEAQYITNGSGSSQPLGFFPALAAFGDPVGFKTTLSSEPRLTAMARGLSKSANGLATKRYCVTERILWNMPRPS